MNNRKLIKKVIKTIKYDTDYCIEALEELLSFVPKENLIGYLGEDDVCPKCDQYPYSDTDKHCPICFDEIKKEEIKKELSKDLSKLYKKNVNKLKKGVTKNEKSK